jgi:hypothetical protein
MPAMPPGGAPTQTAPAPQREPGQASQLVAEIGDKMSQLLDLMQGKLPDQDVQSFAQIVQGYQGFVEKVLGSSGDSETAEPGPKPMGATPAEAGGNPNAKAM